jgi:F0F1-type ATP synthase assembly protein I
MEDRRETYNGFGDALARAVELVATPLLFGLLGYVLDRVLGTRPLLTVVLSVAAVVGMFLRMYYGYATAMDAHARRLPAGRDRP